MSQNTTAYPDLHAHLDELKKRGLLQVIDRPIDKDSELHHKSITYCCYLFCSGDLSNKVVSSAMQQNFVHKSVSINQNSTKTMLGIQRHQNQERILRECACTACTKDATCSGGVY